mgnify:CR=1 FL=1
MSEFQAWTSQHRTIRASRDWNALLDHGLVKPASYIIRKNGSYYEAINGSTGKIDYGGANNAGGVSGTDAATVIQQAIDTLPSEGGKIFIKAGTYPCSNTINIQDKALTIIGENLKTVLYFSDVSGINIEGISTEAEIEDLRVTISTLCIEGNDTSGTVGITVADRSSRRVVIDNVMVKHFEAGILTYNCHSVYLNRVISSYNLDYGLRVGYGAEQYANNISVKDSIFEVNGKKGIILIGNGYGITIEDCLMEANGEEGLYIYPLSGGKWSNVLVRRCWFEQNGESGDATTSELSVAWAEVTENLAVEHCLFSNVNAHPNVVNTVSLGYGFNIQLIGNVFITDRTAIKFGSSETQGVIERNDFTQATGTIISGANQMKFKWNRGYVTENSGTAIIPANTKSHQVVFDLVGAPTVVKVTPQFDVSGRWWISNLISGAGGIGQFTFNRTYSGLYSGVLHYNAYYTL